MPATFSMQIAIVVPKGWFSSLISVLSSTARASVRRKLPSQLLRWCMVSSASLQHGHLFRFESFTLPGGTCECPLNIHVIVTEFLEIVMQFRAFDRLAS